jgi:hypothetical protein
MMIDRNKKSKCKLKKDLYLKIEEERKTKSERGRVKTGKVKRAFVVVEREACVERDRTLKPTGLILERLGSDSGERNYSKGRNKTKTDRKRYGK